MGEDWRRPVKAPYVWPAIAAEIRQAYAWVLGGGAKPACVRP